MEYNCHLPTSGLCISRHPRTNSSWIAKKDYSLKYDLINCEFRNEDLFIVRCRQSSPPIEAIGEGFTPLKRTFKRSEIMQYK